MNLIESTVLRIIGESLTTPDVFTDDAEALALIRGSVNDAISELCMLTGAYTQTYFLPLLERRFIYRMTPVVDHIGYVVGCWDQRYQRSLAQTSMLTLSAMDPYWMKTSGRPEMFYQVGLNHIGIYRVPADKGEVLELRCVCIPAPYESDTDEIKVREAYQRAAVYYSVSEYYASRGDAARATEYGAKYLETAGLMSLAPQSDDHQIQLQTSKGRGGWRR